MFTKLLQKTSEKELEVASQQKIVESAIYQAGKDDILIQVKAEENKRWKEWVNKECEDQVNLLNFEGGWSIMEGKRTLDKEDIVALRQIVVSPHYPSFKKILMAYAQQCLRRTNGKVADEDKFYGVLGNWIFELAQYLELLKLPEESAPSEV